MNKLPCPACKKPLWWNGIKLSTNKFDIEGKRWYQFAGPRIYCKYCGSRLRNPYSSKIFYVVTAFFLIINPFIIQPLAKAYGLIVFLPVLAISFAILAVFWPYFHYEKWNDNKKTNIP